MKQYSKLDAIKSIIGEIESIGSTEEDEKAYQNLLEFQPIIRDLVQMILNECCSFKAYQHSKKVSGKKAIDIIEDLHIRTKEVLDEMEEYIKWTHIATCELAQTKIHKS